MIKSVIWRGGNLYKQAAFFAFVGFFVAAAVYATTTISNNIVTGGTLDVTDATTLTTMTSTKATSSTAFWVGSAGNANWLDMAGGDLFVQGDTQLAGALTVGGRASSTSLAVGGTATTTKLIVGERQAANATTTVIFGDLVSESAPCIKLRTTSGEWVYAYPTSSSAMTASAFGLQWSTNSCE